MLIFYTEKQKIGTTATYSKRYKFSGWAYSSGFISADMIKDHLFPPSDDDLVVMCGPPPMINFACIPNLDKLDYNPEMRFSY